MGRGDSRQCYIFAGGQEVKIAFAGAGIRSLLTKYAVLKKL